MFLAEVGGGWAWRMSRAARGFGSTTAGGVMVHFNPRTWDDLDVDLFLMCCRHACSDLTRRFGFSVGRVRAFLFDSREDVAKLYGRPYVGFAMPGANWIVIARHEFIEETARHELVHLYAGRWNKWAPALLCEGLAVWLTRFHFGRPIDGTARGLVRNFGPLTDILDHKRFHDPQHSDGHYILAGSFTGYLLRHYDWERYRELYRRTSYRTFERDFLRFMGVTLQKAEANWRAELRQDNVVKIIR